MKSLEEKLETVKANLKQSELERQAIVKQVDELKQTSEALRLTFLEIRQEQENKDKLNEAEISRLKRSRWKWALTAGAVGVVTGLVLGLAGN